jgi:hypothetical protein
MTVRSLSGRDIDAVEAERIGAFVSNTATARRPGRELSQAGEGPIGGPQAADVRLGGGQSIVDAGRSEIGLSGNDLQSTAVLRQKPPATAVRLLAPSTGWSILGAESMAPRATPSTAGPRRLWSMLRGCVGLLESSRWAPGPNPSPAPVITTSQMSSGCERDLHVDAIAVVRWAGQGDHQLLKSRARRAPRMRKSCSSRFGQLGKRAAVGADRRNRE